MHMPTMSMLPISASAMPPSSPKSGRGSVKKLQVERVEALEEHGAEHEREDRDGDEGGQDGEEAEELLGQAPPGQAVRAGRDVELVAGLRRGRGAHTALRCFSNRRTMNCAATFVTSEMTIRIAAEVEERPLLERARRPLVLRRDPRAERVGRGEERDVDVVAAADHLCHGDRLAERAPEPEEHRGRDAGRRVGEHHAPDRLPARRAERQRRRPSGRAACARTARGRSRR